MRGICGIRRSAAVAFLGAAFLVCGAPSVASASVTVSAPWGFDVQNAVPAGNGLMTYHGGPVLHNPAVHPYYWAPSGFTYPSGYQTFAARLFADTALAGASSPSLQPGNVMASAREYYDLTQGSAGTAITIGATTQDANSYPASGCTVNGYSQCLTQQQIGDEVDQALGSAARGLANVYVVMLPSDVAVCGDGTSTSCSPQQFCSYHDALISPNGTTLLEVIPLAGQACDNTAEVAPQYTTEQRGLETLFAHETNGILVDPTGDGWWGVGPSNDEPSDRCQYYLGVESYAPTGDYNETFGQDNYDLQTVWTNTQVGNGGCVQNPPQTPVANVNLPASATPNQTFQPSAAGSTQPGGSITSYAWNFYLNGNQSSTAIGVSPLVSLSQNGTYTVVLFVTGSAGVQTVWVGHIGIGAQPATAVISPSTTSPSPGQQVSFDASSSTMPNPPITTYSWQFGDGGSASGATATHSYAAAGNFTVTLSITDSQGLTVQSTQTIHVVLPGGAGDGTLAAITAFSGLNNLAAGQSIAFGAASSSAGPGLQIRSYIWVFSDSQSPSSGMYVTHQFAAVGTYTVRLTVFDTAGQSSSTSVTVSVTHGPSSPGGSSDGGGKQPPRSGGSSSTASVGTPRLSGPRLILVPFHVSGLVGYHGTLRVCIARNTANTHCASHVLVTRAVKLPARSRGVLAIHISASVARRVPRHGAKLVATLSS
jgi:PKD repeat protein